MIEAQEDQAAVSFQRQNDVIKSEEFMKLGIKRPTGSDAEGRLNIQSDPQAKNAVQSIPSAVEAAEAEAGETGTEAQVIVPSASPAPPEDPGAALRRARLSVVVCIVLGLMLAWIVQRRNGSAR